MLGLRFLVSGLYKWPSQDWKKLSVHVTWSLDSFYTPSKWFSTQCLSISRERNSSFLWGNSIFLGLCRLKVLFLFFFKNGSKIHLIIITYLSYLQSYRKRLIFHPHYNTWNIWWHFLSYDAHLWCWSKFLHHSDCFPRICLLTPSLFFPSHSEQNTIILVSLTNAEEKPDYQLHCYRYNSKGEAL